MAELQIALNTIKKEIGFICDNYDSFVNHFCHKSTFDIYGISFDGLNIKFNAVNDNGSHSCHEKTIAQYLRWKGKL